MPRSKSETCCRVLIVDDDPSVVLVLKSLLRKRGLVVTSAESAAQGREYAAGGEYDVALVDVGLRDGSGIELGEELEARYGLAGRVILMTGGHAPRAERCVLKPFNFAVLAEQISQLAHQGEAARPPVVESDTAA